MSNLEKIEDIRTFAKCRTSWNEFNEEINAWVFIWYPSDDNVGHISMYIGKIAHDSTYVSWWPLYHDSKILFKHYPAAFSLGYEEDCERERTVPDVIYGIKSLDERAMKESWHNILHSKDSPSFRTISKNCSNIVGRVIKAGLANSPLRHKLFGFMDGNFYIPTPKRIAVVCNTLRDNNLAVKIRLSPKKKSFSPLLTALRLR